MKLYSEIRRPESAAKAVILIVHGIGEHIGRYAHVIQFFNTRGFAVACYDMRGHGKSPGRRGDSPSYQVLLDDLEHFLDEVKQEFKTLPLFLYGHSMGGNLTANLVMRRSPVVTGVVLSCPGMKPYSVGARWKLALAKALRPFFPGITVSNDVNAGLLSRDASVVAEYKCDRLVHDRISLRLGLEIIEAGKWAVENAAAFKAPLLFMQAGKDYVVDAETNLGFARRVSGPCVIKEWPDLYHEIHNEPEYEEVLLFVTEWIESALSQS